MIRGAHGLVVVVVAHTFRIVSHARTHRSKEQWLWAEGDAYRRRTGLERPHHRYGIYSIAHRADSQLHTCRLPVAALVAAVDAADADNDNDQRDDDNNGGGGGGGRGGGIASGSGRTLMKERVRKISLRVDTMRLSDDTGTSAAATRTAKTVAPASTTMSDALANDNYMDDGESGADEVRVSVRITVEPE